MKLCATFTFPAIKKYDGINISFNFVHKAMMRFAGFADTIFSDFGQFEHRKNDMKFFEVIT